jgi:hypothetical protein
MVLERLKTGIIFAFRAASRGIGHTDYDLGMPALTPLAARLPGRPLIVSYGGHFGPKLALAA